jgi:hypothetical protein
MVDSAQVPVGYVLGSNGLYYKPSGDGAPYALNGGVMVPHVGPLPEINTHEAVHDVSHASRPEGVGPATDWRGR